MPGQFICPNRQTALATFTGFSLRRGYPAKTLIPRNRTNAYARTTMRLRTRRTSRLDRTAGADAGQSDIGNVRGTP